MSPWTWTLPGPRRTRLRISGLQIATIGAVFSLLYLFVSLALPQLLRLRFRAGLSWYDLGFYGFGPSRSYVSFDYESPRVQLEQYDTGCDPRYTFLAPRGDSIAQPGPMILDAQGELVWMKHNWETTQDFKVQHYKGQDYLAYWEGGEIAGRGYGSWYLLDSTYTQRYEITPVGNYGGDLHEFHLTPEGTALVTIYDPTPADLTSVGGPALGWIFDGLFQELDIETGELLFEWRASKHLDVNNTYEALGETGRTRETAFDYHHINSVDKDDDGNYLVSARHFHTVSCIDRHTGDILWTLGGKQNEFTDQSEGAATNFAWQHDARWHGNGTLTLFDNQAHSNEDDGESRGLVLSLDIPARTAALRAEYYHPQQMKAVSQGNVQLLDDTGRALVGWGHSAAYSEYSADGQLVCNVHFGASAFFTFGRVVSYRTFKDNWVGHPTSPPDAEVVGDHVYVSWNGATEVVAWRLEVWDTEDLDEQAAFEVVAQFPKTGFETEIEIPEDLDRPLFRIAALDRDGESLGVTDVLQRDAELDSKVLLNLHNWILGVAFVLAGVGLVTGLYQWCCCSRCFRRCRNRANDYQLVALSENYEDRSPV